MLKYLSLLINFYFLLWSQLRKAFEWTFSLRFLLISFASSLLFLRLFFPVYPLKNNFPHVYLRFDMLLSFCDWSLVGDFLWSFGRCLVVLPYFIFSTVLQFKCLKSIKLKILGISNSCFKLFHSWYHEEILYCLTPCCYRGTLYLSFIHTVSTTHQSVP